MALYELVLSSLNNLSCDDDDFSLDLEKSNIGPILRQKLLKGGGHGKIIFL